MPNIYEAIKADHDTHRALLDRIADTEGASDERQEAWDVFYEDVKSHSAAEEETFYSKLMSKTWGQDAARHSVQEHAEMNDLLEELREMGMSHGSWIEKFKQLKRDYEHHMDEEEHEVFERAKEVIPDDEIAGYGDRFLARKKEERGLIEEKREDALED